MKDVTGSSDHVAGTALTTHGSAHADAASARKSSALHAAGDLLLRADRINGPGPFNKAAFDRSIFAIQAEAEAALTLAYPGHHIHISVQGLTRTLEQQAADLKKGTSETMISAHNLGAAADLYIYCDGKMVNPGNEKSIATSSEPYRIMGAFILKAGYFWGLKWDPGHTQVSRQLVDILKQHAELKDLATVQHAYAELDKEKVIPARYRPFMEYMDDAHHVTKMRAYDETQANVMEQLLQPITMDGSFHSKFSTKGHAGV